MLKTILLLLLGVIFVPLSASGVKKSQWFLDGDFLWFETKEDGLDYIRYLQNSLEAQPIKTVSPHQKCDAGFRIALGYKGDCARWYSSLAWTHLRNRARSRYNKSIIEDGGAYSLQTRDLSVTEPLISVAAFAGEADWKLNYDTVDLEIGVPCCSPWEAFVVAPFIGARGAFFNKYFNNDVASFGQILHSERATCDFNAGGVRAGVNVTWNIGSGFGIYGSAAGSLVYGRFKINDTVLTTISPPSPLTYTARRNRVRTNLEGSLGLQFSTPMQNDGNFTIRAGYQAIDWLDQNQFPGPITAETTRSSSLCLHGIQGSIWVDF